MTQSMQTLALSRRQFLVGSGGIAIGVAFGVPALTGAQRAQAQAAGFSPNVWVTIAANGSVTIVSPASEMGQGTMTAMPLVLAEELDADWSRVSVVQAGHNPKAFGNRLFGGAMATGASRTTRGYWEPIRLAGAQARLVLMGAAAGRWNVPVSEVATEPGVVVHRASNRRLSYGEIASFATVPDPLPAVTPAMLKKPAEFRLIGKDVPRIDLADKTRGGATYGIDVRLPGMLYGAVLRPPVQKDRPVSVDDSGAKAVKGFVKTVQLPYGVGVLANSTWAARKARDALKVTWSNDSPARRYDSEAIGREYAELAANLDLSKAGVEVEKHGSGNAGIKGAARVLKADFLTEHMAHMCMEPMNATAQWHAEDRIELWSPTQSPTIAAGAISALTKVPVTNIRINNTLLGGGFGRRVDPDFSIDAALLARAADGWPVKVTWTREDDVRNDKFRPLVAQHLEVGLDAAGNIVGWHHRLSGESIYARAAPGLFKAAGGKDIPFHEGAENNYNLPNMLIEFARLERGIDVGFWRSVGGGYTKHAVETMVDEIAAARNMDPVDLRLQLLAKHPRAQAVVREVAAMADWKRARPAGRALGIAYCDMWETHIAEVVEVSVDRKTGVITVHEVWAAVDPGIAVLPKNVLTQIEGGIVFGLSAVLKEQVTFKDGSAVQSNFHDYPILRHAEVPPITVKLIVTDNRPGGVGESGLPPVAPAIANAVAKLTGKRLRHQPFNAARVKAALA
ncbi:MAG: xanthine dehydrogenase family protein molybdopterin-binding subunit [Burkholderiales bacterium]|nr:xanthine dehydrogenase family protein molybdopterin-binding subunit [Burkholderiales bacterium]